MTRVGGFLDMTVTELVMESPPPHDPVAPPRGDLRLEHVARPSVAFYRDLYDAVGADWHWTERRLMPRADLAALLADPQVELWVLWAADAPAGFAEIDRRDAKDIQLAYFGLLPGFIGRGLGRLLLDRIVRIMWQSGPERIRVHTCDLDHPRALPLYRSQGFRVRATRPGRVELPARDA